MLELKEKRDLDLLMYFFTVRELGTVVVPIDGQVVLAYTQQDAFATVAKKYEKPVHIEQQGVITIKELLEQFRLENKEVLKIDLEPKVETKQDFLRNLHLGVDKWIEVEADKKAVHKVLKKYE